MPRRTMEQKRMLVRKPLLPALVTLAVAAALTGCGPKDEADRLATVGPLEGPFWVSDHFAPSGHMGDGELPGFLTGLIAEDALVARRAWCSKVIGEGLLTADQCPDRPPNAGGDPYVFIYNPGQYMWAGVYWVYPANNWGSYPGRALNPNYQYSRVRFRAATDTPGIGANFFIGGIDNSKLTYDDSLPLTQIISPTRHADPARAVPALDLYYQDFVINIRPEYYQDPENPIDSLIGAFGWAMNLNNGPKEGPRAIFIDDIVWE